MIRLAVSPIDDTRVRYIPTDSGLWDSDGTLVGGTETLLAVARNTVLNARGFALPPTELLRGHTGVHAKNVVLNYIRSVQGDSIAEIALLSWNAIVYDIFTVRARLFADPVYTADIHLFPDAVGLLERMQVVPHALITNGSADLVALVFSLVGAQLQPLLSDIVTKDQVPAPKPDPAMCLHARQKLRTVAPVVFGDSPIDVEAAVNAGFPVVVVDRDNHFSFTDYSRDQVVVVRTLDDVAVEVC